MILTAEQHALRDTAAAFAAEHLE
ncbi:hypothetical protein, partial [Frankia sp. CpI1-P]